MLNGTVPLFAALVGAAWFGVPLRRRTMSAIALGVVGLLIAVGRPSVDGAASIVPVLAMIGACASYGVGVNVAKRRFAGVPTMTVAVGQLVAAAALVLPLGLTSIPSLMPSPATIASLVALGVLCTAVAWPLLFRVVARFGAVAGSSVTLVIPLFGILWGVLLLGETPSAGLVGGTAVIATSLLLIFDVPILALARRLIHPETATQELPRAG